MKIIVLENEPSSLRGGQELSLLDISRGLARKGHEIIFLYVKEGDLLASYREFASKVIQVRGYRFSKLRPIATSLGLLRDLLRVGGLKCSLVYANQYFDSLFAALLARLTDCPFVCHLRLPPPERFSRQYRFGMSRADFLMTVSEQTKREYVQRGFEGRNIKVIYNGVDMQRFTPSDDPGVDRLRMGLPAEAFVVTYAGRLHPVKGLEKLLDAFKAIRSEGRARLVIAGKPAELDNRRGAVRDYRHELHAYANSLAINGDILWMEHHPDIPTLFRASDAVVLPSLWPEPFGRVLIESMACGTPALGSQVGGIPEILSGEFSSFLFRAGSSGELSILLKKIRNWRKEDPGLGARCRSHIAQYFALGSMVEAVEAAFLEALERYQKGFRARTAAAKIQ